MDRVLRDTAATISVTLYVDGEAAAATGTPTVTITKDSTGVAVVTAAATTAGATGVYSYTLTPAQIAEVDLLTAVWTFTQSGVANQQMTTNVEVVGGFLCTIAQIQAALPDKNTSTVTELRAARDWAEDWLEQACGVAFRPRYLKETIDGNGTDLMLARPLASGVISASVSDTALSPTEISELSVNSRGFIYRSAGWTAGRDNVDVAYIHGHARTPAPVIRAAIKLARFYLLEDPTNYEERATSMTTEDATYSFVTAGVRGARSSIPEVNQVIDDYCYVTI